MTDQDQAGDGRPETPPDQLQRRSFHTRLLVRSEASLPDPWKPRPLQDVLNRWGWIGRVLGQGAIFVGGLAIGCAIMLIRRGEESRSRPALMIGAGIACVLFAILAQVLVRDADRRPTSPIRG